MTRYLAIDPGCAESAFVHIDDDTLRPGRFGKFSNERMLAHLDLGWQEIARPEKVAIEMVASYGMAVGAEVFDTCVWIGRFVQLLAPQIGLENIHLVKRLPVKLHHCHDSKAKDSNIRQALVDRFAPGVSNYGKGTAKEPGWFHGFSADVWAAYALAVYAADTGLAELAVA
jgi:hypothetical protein